METTFLVGRHGDVQALLQAYRRSSHKATTGGSIPEIVMIRGLSGTGKTALANSIYPTVKQDEGYFLSGKFNFSNAVSTPYAVFAAAFSQFTDQLLEARGKDGARFLEMCDVIQKAMGSEGKLLVKIIPALGEILDISQEEGEEQDINGPEAFRCFQFLFCRLCLAASTVAPIVLFLDDLHWIDTASLQLLQALTFEPQNHQFEKKPTLLVIGAYRLESNNHGTKSNMCGETLPFSQYLSEVDSLSKSLPPNVTTIDLQNLNEHAINQLVIKVLGVSDSPNTELGATIFSASNGNPLHAVQILNVLVKQRSGAKTSLEETSFDPQTINSATWTSTLDELFRRKFTTLPQRCQSVLQAAASMGDEIDEQAIALVLDLNLKDVTASLQAANEEGHCVFNEQRGRYRFAHDRNRQTALSTIDDKNNYFFQLGYQLWTKSSPLFLSTNKFVVAQLSNYGVERMTNPTERYSAAAFNMDVGIDAASKADFPDSSRFLSVGIEFLRGCGDHWTEQYDLSLNLFSAAADTAICTQAFDNVEALVKEVLEHGRSLQDKLTAYIAEINSLGQRGLINEALAIGLDVLRQLGEPLPKSATKIAIIWEVFITKLALRGRSDNDLLRLRPMHDRNKLAAIHVLSVLQPYAYQTVSAYYPLLGTRLVRMCLKFGMHKNCALGFSAFSTLICGYDPKEAYRLGSVALSIAQRWRARALLPRVQVSFYSLIHHWKFPLRESLKPLEDAIKAAVEIGDTEVAMIGMFYECSNRVHSGLDLCQVEKHLIESIQQMRNSKQEVMLQCTCYVLQFVQNLTGSASDLDAAFSMANIPEPEQIRAPYYVWGANLAFRFGKYELANRLAVGADSLKFKPTTPYGFSARLQMNALIACARYRLGQTSAKKTRKICKVVWKKMKSWETNCTENFSFKRRIVEAELLSLNRHRNQSESNAIMSLYDEAVSEALKNDFTNEAALANELAGDYLHRQGEADKALLYWNQAHRLYLKWGATSKASQLAAEKELPIED